MAESYFDLIKRSRPVSEVSREVFLNSLSAVDKENIEKMIAGFESSVNGTGGNSTLVAVGKSVADETRGTPRKDIDMLILKDGGTDFRTFVSRARSLAELLQFTLGDITYPDPDYDYGHDGSVKIIPQKGTQIDLLPSVSRLSVGEILDRMRRETSTHYMPQDFCILVRT
ncbi:MAG: hypothetical protein Q8N98_01830 [bacterium]|nr:hypothetical protein [bacterium]